MRDKKLILKDKFEQTHLGQFEMLYPLNDNEPLMKKYDYILEKSKEVWEE